MALTIQQKKALRGLAHHLNPVIQIGAKGVTDALMDELNSTLDHHELIKIRINEGDREERKAIIEAVVNATGAELVQSIGKVFVLFRRNPEKKDSDFAQLR
ncbi:RNA-binding protein [Sulfurivirga caldicuralii]|uniref:RNA-binding protein n=1 Tax=Sulfurivirga caldicuralii TaxID=364032 RepID=A0A1N6ESI7_9GAMM|nr:ribosome assembly RNA-binding protein YhbY [Sulfurivirga caldicuralii]SIN86072.1 RNA-binding protein [Sulfurivirga caldicuralii]